MFTRIYVLKGETNLDELASVIRRRGTIQLTVQKYVAVGEKQFQKVWVDPAQCTLRPCNFGNDLVRSDESELVNVVARVVNVSTTRPEPEMKKFEGAKELLGLSINFYYDAEQKVGLIIDGYNGYSRRAVLSRVRLDVALNEDELASQTLMKTMGIPEELWGCPQLLREMSEL